jgi:hypothetical protein
MDLTDSTDLPSMAGHNDELTMYIWFCCPVMLKPYGSIVRLTVVVQILILPLHFPVPSDMSHFVTACAVFVVLSALLFLSHLLRKTFPAV